jgi:Domain of unknown function (DUF4252)
MRLFRVAFLAIMAVLVLSAGAQPQPTQAPPNDWVPQGIEALRQNASSKTEFTLDHSMLVFASKLDPDNDDLRRVIAGVSGVSVHNYRFPHAGMYDPEVLDSVRAEYHTAGWKQLVNNHGKGGAPGATDVWIRFENNAVSNVALLFVRASEVDFVVVNGSISPLDLSHLGGHFGIPKIEGGVTVPNDRH